MFLDQEIIRSRQNRTVVEVCKLADRKARDASKSFRFDGIKLFEEAIKKQLHIELVLLRASTAERVAREMLDRCGRDVLEDVGRVLLLSDEVFEKISEEKSPEGVICVAKYIDKFQKFATIYNSENFLPSFGERLVLIEAVRDPSNIGAIIRSAAALGVDDRDDSGGCCQ